MVTLVTNNQLVTAYLIHLEVEKNYSLNTCEQYGYDLRLFLKCLKNKAIKEITTLDIRQFLVHLKKDRNYAPASLHRKICAIRSFYRFLTCQGYLDTDPSTQIASPKVPRSLPKFLTLEQVEAFLKNIRNIQDKAIVELLYSSGLRVSELCMLNIDDINFKENIIKVRKAKGDKQRYVLFNDRVKGTLVKYLQKRKKPIDPTDKTLFLNRIGKRMRSSSVQGIVARYRKLAKLPRNITPHTLRHTFATHLMQNGADIRSIQELLGHASLSTTQLYTHVDTNHLKRAYNQAHPFSRGITERRT